MSTPSVTLEVAHRFEGLRRRYLIARLAIATSTAAALVMTLWMLVAITDYFQEWPLAWLRTAMAIGIAGIIVWFVSRCVIIFRDVRSRQFAALLERSFDGFGQRIRTVLDTVSGRVSGPEEMLTALGHQTLGRWETLSPGQLIPWRGLSTAVALCLACAVLAGIAYFRGSDISVAMQRSLGNDLAYTTLHVQPGNQKILEGLPVKVALELKGRTNRDVVLRHRMLDEDVPESASSAAGVEHEWNETELTLADVATNPESTSRRHAAFEFSLGSAQRPVEYQFVTSAGTTDVYRIDIQPLIEVERIETIVQPPAYTQLEERTFATRDISALERSLVTVTIQTSHPLQKAVLETGSRSSTLEPSETAMGAQATLWSFVLPATDSLHWRFSGDGSDGTPMTAVTGRLRVRRDNAPKITWRDPSDEIKVHTLAEVPMRVHIADDYGITEAGMVFQLGDDEDFVLAEWLAESDIQTTDNRTSLTLEQILPLESFALTERDFISYYAYAVDNRDGALQRTESDMRYIDVRPLRQFFGEVELPPSDGEGNGSLRVTLSELIRRQRFLINRTRKLTRSNSTSLASQLGTIDQMVESQSELAGLVRFLTEFLISRGNDDVEALNQAEAAMLQASDSLAAASFDLALVQENDALLALAEARRTLDIFLIKNQTPQQRQQMARFARQLQQKLRRERPKTERQLADSLKQIANQQMQLSQMACQIPSANGSSGQGGDGAKGNGANGTPMNAKAAEAEATDADADVTEANGPDANAAEANNNETEPTEAKGTEAAAAEGDSNNSSEPQEDSNPQEELYAKQVELLERMQAIEEQLTERLADSELMAQRMASAKAGMDQLASQARDGNLGSFREGSQDVAEQVAELGAHLNAVQEAEAVARVSAIRDMTAALSGMEHELSQKLDEPAQANANSGASGNGNPNPNPGAEPNAGNGQMRLANRIKERTQTIEDVLKVPVDVGDVKTSDVNLQLETFLQQTEFLEQLLASREAAAELSREDEKRPAGSSAQDARQRALEFAEASQLLDDLYQQLVTPRLARLRELEHRATQLAQQASQGGTGEPQETDPETEAGLATLKEELEDEGLKGLADLLDPAEIPDDDIAALLQNMSGNKADSRTVAFADSVRSRQLGRVTLLVRRLREQIQETVLLEISADRDAPVPGQYRDLVDGYFRTLAGEDNAK